jgi:hypothetical protein
MGHWIDYEPNFDDIDPQELQNFYEVDMWLDMDGDDYEEPYTVTINLEDNACVVKCLQRWTKRTIVSTKDYLIFRPVRRYYAYKMIPDAKGSFFPRGFGWLLSKTEHSLTACQRHRQYCEAGIRERRRCCNWWHRLARQA